MTTRRPRKYAARLLTALPVWEVGPLRLKPYWIDTEDVAEPPEPLLSAAQEVAASILPKAAEQEGESSGLGFAILHRGLVRTWLHMDWWAHNYMCCQRQASAEPGSTAFLPVTDPVMMAGIWSMTVMWREREAWVSTMMTGDPNPAAYLRRRLADGWY